MVYLLDGDCNVKSAPPSRTARPRRPHSTRRKRRTRNCCLVSESWVPRTRKHLFASIRFLTVKNLQSWKKAFPDPSTSPAHYTKTLLTDCADVEVGSWIGGFSQVVHLELGSQRMDTNGRIYLLSHSTDSHPSSNLSAWPSSPPRPRGFLTSSFYSPTSMTRP